MNTTGRVQAAIFKIKNNNEGNNDVLSTEHRSVNMKPNHNDRKPDAI